MATTTPVLGLRKPATTDHVDVTLDIDDNMDLIDAGVVPKSLYDANTILAATTDNTPVALTVGASTIVGRKSSGGIVALTGAEALTITGGVASADPTFTGTMTAAIANFSGLVTTNAGLTLGASQNLTLSAGNIVTDTTTGTQIATAASQKLGFFGATPVIQVTGSTDVLAGMVTLGFRAASSNPPLNLGTGALTAGVISNGIFNILNSSSTSTPGTPWIRGTTSLLAINSNGGGIIINPDNADTFTVGQNGSQTIIGTTTVNQSTNALIIKNRNSASSGGFVGVAITPTITQSSTAGYTGLLVNATESSTGSGSKLLIDLQVAAASKFSVSDTGLITMVDAANIAVGTSTGTQIATATSQKLGFFGATPVIQVTGSTDVLASLVTLGLRAASSNPPLDLGTGILSCGTITSTTGGTVFTANAAGIIPFTVKAAASPSTDILNIQDSTGAAKVSILNNFNLSFVSGVNIAFGTGTGTKIGTGTTQKIGFYNTAPVAQSAAITLPAATASTNVTPFGYSQAQADAIVTAVRALINQLGTTGGGIGLFA